MAAVAVERRAEGAAGAAAAEDSVHLALVMAAARAATQRQVPLPQPYHLFCGLDRCTYKYKPHDVTSSTRMLVD